MTMVFYKNILFQYILGKVDSIRIPDNNQNI